MPKLKNLVCQVQWAKTGVPFPEYDLRYGDGVAEVYITVPNYPQAFRIQLTSTAFIHEGLAAFVYIDGRYQSNRNRVNLLPPKRGRPRDRTEINFILRQKEQSLGDELYMGREWRFDDHNIGNNSLVSPNMLIFALVPTLPEGVTDSHFAMLGNIEVVVYRCVAADDNDANLSTTSSGEESDLDEWESKLANLISGEHGELVKEDQRSAKPSPKTNAKSAVEEDLCLMGGLFDGPGDYYRHPPPWSDHFFRERNWRSQPSAYRQPPPPPTPPANSQPFYDDGGWVSYYQRHGPDPADLHPGYQYPDSRPPPQHPLPSKRVHFDHGPPPDAYRYTDEPFPTAMPQGRPTTREFPGGWDGARPGYGRQPVDRSYGPPPPQQYAPHSDPHYSQPSYGNMHNPQRYFTYSGHAPQYAVGGRSRYHPYAGSQAQVPDVNWSQTSDGPGAAQKPGSLDPAKEENNTSGAGWNVENKEGWNQDSNSHDQNKNTGGQSGWNDGDKQQEGDKSWETDQNQNQEVTDDWEKGKDQDKDKKEDWGMQNPTTSNSESWDTSNQNNAATDTWNTTNNDSSATNDQAWGNNPSISQSTNDNGPMVKPLYGPYGAYYAAQSTIHSNVPWLAEEEPRYDVPQTYADGYFSSKQVQPGRGYRYFKKRSRVIPVDTREEPYAKFVFKYRTKEELKKEIDIDVEVEPSGDREVQEFQSMPKDDLIQLLLRAKGHLGGRIPSPPPTTSESPEIAPSKGVAIAAPDMNHLEYDIPMRGGDAKGKAAKANDGGANGDWSAPAQEWNNSSETANTQFPQEAYEAAKKQQQSGPPPSPPPRRDAPEPKW